MSNSLAGVGRISSLPINRGKLLCRSGRGVTDERATGTIVNSCVTNEVPGPVIVHILVGGRSRLYASERRSSSHVTFDLNILTN